VALWPELAADVWRGENEKQERLGALRASLAGFSLINCVRFLTARRANDPAWERCLPPLSPLSRESAILLTEALDEV
jgi:hypothetical protein